MLNSGKKIRVMRDKKNNYSNSRVVRTKMSERNKKPYPSLQLNVRPLRGVHLKKIPPSIDPPWNILSTKIMHIHVDFAFPLKLKSLNKCIKIWHIHTDNEFCVHYELKSKNRPNDSFYRNLYMILLPCTECTHHWAYIRHIKNIKMAGNRKGVQFDR